MFGKARLMLICLVVLGIANIIGALTTSFELLFVSRLLCGMAAGGTFPIAIGLTSDLVPPHQRQVALGRVLAGGITGNLLGASAGGVIGDLFGWRSVLVVLGILMLICSIVAFIGFRQAGVAGSRSGVTFATLRHGYRTILANPNAVICFSSVFIEGLCILGAFPFVAAFLFDLGETRASIPGLVIGAFAVGGLIYSMTVSRLLARVSVRSLMIAGATTVAAQFLIVAFGPRWEVHALCFLLMGWGFYSLHGSLQVFASELAPEARASAVSLHAFFFFMGQAAGPVVYGFGLAHAGKQSTLFVSALMIFLLGLISATLLNRKPTAPAPA